MLEIFTAHIRSLLPVTPIVPALSALPVLMITLMFAACLCLAAPAVSLAATQSNTEAATPVSTQPEQIWGAGTVAVLAIQDMPGNMSIDLFSGPASPEERAKYFINGQTPAGVNVFLIQLKGEAPVNILVDTGFGMEGQSKLMQGLAMAGVSPEQVHLVLLTHMHGDHIGGLLGPDGKRVFTNAKILLASPEANHWVGTGKQAPDPDNAAEVFDVLQAYSQSMPQPFEFGRLNLPLEAAANAQISIEALDASGHTPGHTAFMLEAAGQKLLIIGDLVHAAELQLALPNECARYDLDMPQAVKARKRILGMASDQELQIAGMHIPFPATGKVTSQFHLLPR